MTSNNNSWKIINKGKPIFFKNEKHYIVYELDKHFLISKNKDLSMAFSVEKISCRFSKKQNKKK